MYFPSRVVIVSLVAFLLPVAAVLSDETSVPVARDLAADGERSRSQSIPILLLVSQSYCPFCDRLKEEVIRPMILSGDYKDKVLIRELLLDPEETVKDFDGSDVNTSELMDRFRIWVTPTLLFLGPAGQELSARILGINTLELYSYYVDNGLERARQSLRGKLPVYRASESDYGAWSEGWDLPPGHD